MKSILFISDLDIWSISQNTGGPALSKTLMAYRDNGWHVTFITSNASTENQHVEGIEIVRFSLPTISFFFRLKKIGFIAKITFWIIFQLKVFWLAIHLNKKCEFNLVYGYEVTGIPIARMLAWLWSRPLVSRFQGSSFGVGWRKKRFRTIRAWNHWIALSLPADLFIMTNDGTQGDAVLTEFRQPPERIRFWMNGIDKQLYCPKQFDESLFHKQIKGEAAFQLLTISRLVYWKRVDWAIEALAEVVKKIPNVELVIVGEGEDRSGLEELSNRLGVRDKINFVGAVPHVKTREYLQQCDIFLSLYDWSNVGNPLLEAMLSGTCIVTVNTGDTGSLIKQEENGILLPDLQSTVAPAIANALKDFELRTHLGQQARVTAEMKFWTWDARLDCELKEVDALLNSRL